MKLTKGAVTAEALPQVRDKLLQADRIEDIDLPGLSSDRRPIIAGGVLVLEAAFRSAGAAAPDGQQGRRCAKASCSTCWAGAATTTRATCPRRR